MFVKTHLCEKKKTVLLQSDCWLLWSLCYVTGLPHVPTERDYPPPWSVADGSEQIKRLERLMSGFHSSVLSL